MLFFARPGVVFGFAQVGERLKPTDCKSVPLRRYGGSNPPLCTRLSRLAGVNEAGARWRNPERFCEGSAVTEVDDQEEVRTGSRRICGARCFGLDNAVRRGDSDCGLESEAANGNADDSGVAGFQVGLVLLADEDRRAVGVEGGVVLRVY